MKRWRAKLLLASGAAALAFALPAAGQEEKAPESLLPPGFGDPADAPNQPQPQPDQPAAPAPSETPAVPPGFSAPPPGGGESLVVEDSAAEDLEALAELENLPPPIEIPDAARRPTDVVGPLTPGNWGLGADAFGNVNGPFAAALMRRLDAPLPSRWLSMLLRRALLSRIPAPPHIDEVDWVAERAWLLLRMGEADAARALVQAIDVDRFTPRMFPVAVETALATADPAGLCPLVEPGREVSEQRIWPLAEAMCAALAGEAAQASQLIDRARSRNVASGIDLSLAEKVIGAGLDTRRAVTIEWEPVQSLNSWRFGLASATGLSVPDRLMQGAGGQFHAWQARAPMVPIEERVPAAFRAAALGVFSSSSLVDIFSLIGDATDPADMEGTIADRLRRAYVADSPEARIDAMANLWDAEGEPGSRYARLILTAGAAARVPPSEERAEHADEIIASLFAAGLDKHAGRWGPAVEAMNDADRAWALLAVGTDPLTVDLGRAGSVIGEFGEHRGRMLAAALAGLGRLDDPADYGVDVSPSRWSNMLAQAARNDQPGMVALLAGIGMQTSDWRGVPPGHLYHILRALRAVGLGFEARMIAAEAMTRL